MYKVIFYLYAMHRYNGPCIDPWLRCVYTTPENMIEHASSYFVKIAVHIVHVEFCEYYL